MIQGIPLSYIIARDGGNSMQRGIPIRGALHCLCHVHTVQPLIRDTYTNKCIHVYTKTSMQTLYTHTHTHTYIHHDCVGDSHESGPLSHLPRQRGESPALDPVSTHQDYFKTLSTHQDYLKVSTHQDYFKTLSTHQAHLKKISTHQNYFKTL